jgi:N-acetylmuramic acid 6-phosphate etherase
LDKMSALEIVQLMNRQDHLVVAAVERCLPALADLVEATAARLGQGGRLFYVGAGTSGRLGMLDAAECPPTFGTPPERVQAVLAGGSGAFLKAVEHAEDRYDVGAQEMEQRQVGLNDVVVGISASGRTPFVLGALEQARRSGALTGSLFCNPGCPLELAAEHPVLLEVGPEVVAGSTRLKAGTATKMALNMLSTGVMVRLGKTLGNLMADLTPTCEKLRLRSVRILAHSAGLEWTEAERLLDEAGGDLRKALSVGGEPL